MDLTGEAQGVRMACMFIASHIADTANEVIADADKLYAYVMKGEVPEAPKATVTPISVAGSFSGHGSVTAGSGRASEPDNAA